ncbi:E3 ubiquitin-protein ligase TRIM69-like [Acipenser ruthenus]|uniref:E3 ubiquitin-protein ligase TRIM69-like n=1 Tax=Acipenser ruthenus TaxID=7906 RepID=UPI00274115A7|nr:E3 ubiquitin-protein ligase TRIM69-like [Acipenser ruthenus]XP_058871395.1 E3 ubiquitin-protein ligase TRIM69-like [Acipenser ruthenus]XP_058871396.1 E3 ubiquitin-protein ligase TRIM69-like [Acipenser ruthenus]
MAFQKSDRRTGTSEITSICLSFGSFDNCNKVETSARDSRSYGLDKPNLTNDKITDWTLKLKSVMKSVFKSKKSRRQVITDWSLEECRGFIINLAKELNKVSQNTDIPHSLWKNEDTFSLVECRSFIMEWAKELNRRFQISERSSLDLTPRVAFSGSEGTEEKDGGQQGRGEQRHKGQNMGEEKSKGGEQILKQEQKIIMEWAMSLKSVPVSISLGEDVSQVLDELVKEWKRGKLSNILPILELIMWALILGKPQKGTIPCMWLSMKQRSQTIGAVRCIPDSVWKWIIDASVDVTLDQETANPDLILSKDRKRVRSGAVRNGHLVNSSKYMGWYCVLGMEGFTSGRQYWEVEVGEKRDWRLGVTTKSSTRNGYSFLNTSMGYWTLRLERGSEFKALTVPFTPLPLSLKPQRLGVYLDYEEGQLSFYDAEKKSHIYTYTEDFTDKLYPVFGTVDTESNADLVIVSHAGTHG